MGILTAALILTYQDTTRRKGGKRGSAGIHLSRHHEDLIRKILSEVMRETDEGARAASTKLHRSLATVQLMTGTFDDDQDPSPHVPGFKATWGCKSFEKTGSANKLAPTVQHRSYVDTSRQLY